VGIGPPSRVPLATSYSDAVWSCRRGHWGFAVVAELERVDLTTAAWQVGRRLESVEVVASDLAALGADERPLVVDAWDAPRTRRTTMRGSSLRPPLNVIGSTASSSQSRWTLRPGTARPQKRRGVVRAVAHLYAVNGRVCENRRRITRVSHMQCFRLQPRLPSRAERAGGTRTTVADSL
jgi:hypothetical protein